MRVFVLLICVLIAAPAAAQSTSLGVTANWDIARFSRVEIEDSIERGINPVDTLDGDALGFSVNIRRGIGEQWGLGFEFSRSGEIESRTTQRFPGIRTLTPVPVPPPTSTGPIPIPLPIPEFEFELRTEQQHQALNAFAWVAHDVGDRVELSYLGGVAFVRSEFERETSISDRRLTIFIAPTDISTIDLNVRPVVGLDVDIELTDHTAFTGGVRLQGLGSGGRNGWLIRPAVGVRWTF